MNWVVKERFNREWVCTYFETSVQAHTLFKKILKAGGLSICLKAV